MTNHWRQPRTPCPACAVVLLLAFVLSGLIGFAAGRVMLERW